MSEPKKTLGDSIRDFMTPALEDTRRSEIQNDILNEIFEEIADGFEEHLRAKFEAVAKMVDSKSAKRPSMRSPLILEQLTKVNPMTGEPLWSPIIRRPLPLSTAFTLYSADDVKDQPGYIRLHEKAREIDVAVKVIGLTADESKASSGFAIPPILVIDASKTYDEGAIESSNLYPNLPPRKVEFNKSEGRDFKF